MASSTICSVKTKMISNGSVELDTLRQGDRPSTLAYRATTSRLPSLVCSNCRPSKATQSYISINCL